MSRSFPLLKVGILGGGQLARMMIYESRKLGISFIVLDPDPEAPAGPLADVFIRGGLYDPDALARAAGASDVLTYDIEHIDTGILAGLEAEGRRILPSPGCLASIQDKLEQKRLLRRAGIPVPDFEPLPEIQPAPAVFAGPFPFSPPWVQKTRRGGYDGRGVFVIRSEADTADLIPGETMAEEKVDIRKELAVMVARGIDGATAVYPVTEMVFDPVANICTRVVAPADIPESLRRRAEEIAVETARALGVVGMAGIELFLDTRDRILVNEAAPRPHNSGHYTIEACATSQFEQHIRAVSGLPLGSTELLRPGVMINLLGVSREGSAEGGSSIDETPGSPNVPRPTAENGPTAASPVIEGLDEVLAIPGASLHFYGKAVCRPGRKMGHITVTGSSRGEALEKAKRIENIVRIFGPEEH
jgi:5-(carboxyamino)imidazole ribonucleotide synthase